MAAIGLVLSGGGARGVAHLGLLQALDELGIKPQVISGVSAGAVIGALYAAGYTPRQILNLAKEHSPMSVVAPSSPQADCFHRKFSKKCWLKHCRMTGSNS